MTVRRHLDAPVSSTGQALLNTKQNKISQGSLIESGMTVFIVIPAQAGIQGSSGSTLPITHHSSPFSAFSHSTNQLFDYSTASPNELNEPNEPNKLYEFLPTGSQREVSQRKV